MSDSSQDKHREQRFWDKIASERVYAAFDKNEYLEVFEKALGTDLTDKVFVDVGCASGVSAAILASLGAKVLGVDISPELIQQAKRLWTEFPDQLEFTVGDAEHLDLADARADACFFGGVLHHFPVKEKVYQESWRILKPGGKFVALEPNSLDVMERIEWALAGWRGKLSPNEYPINPQEMTRELEQAGFGMVHFWTVRQDIPFLGQMPLLKRFFNRQKGFWLKGPLLRFLNKFRPTVQAGTFFVIEGVKP